MTTGFSVRRMIVQARLSLVSSLRIVSPLGSSLQSERSNPAQKSLPSPASTTASCVFGASSSAVQSAASMSGVSALRFSGRSSSTTAIDLPSRSIVSVRITPALPR